MIEKKDIAQATFTLLQEKDWLTLTLNDIAGHLDISLGDLHPFVTSKENLLGIMAEYIEEKSLEHIDPTLAIEETSKEDRLFDLFLASFEASAPHKKAIYNLSRTFQSNPTVAFHAIPYFIGAAKQLAALANMHFTGPLGGLQLRGFSLIYGRLIHIWLEDDSPDMGKTMAATNTAVTKYIPCLFDPCKVADLF